MYSAFEKFYLRVPAYDLGELRHIGQDLLSFIKYVIGDDYFMSAIEIASPDLYSEVMKLKGISELPKNGKKIGVTLLKYWKRICFRTTPFGQFSGCLLGNIEKSTGITLDKTIGPDLAVRLDMETIWSIVETLSKDPSVKNNIRYYTNNTIYPLGGSYRYIEYRIVDHKRRYAVGQFYRDDLIDEVLAASRRGLRIAEIIDILTSQGSGKSEALSFVHELTEAQILTPGIIPPVMGCDPLEHIINALAGFPETARIRSQLLRIRDIIRTGGPGSDTTAALKEILSDLTGEKDLQHRNLLQVDMYQAARKCSIDTAIIDDIVAGCSDLFALKSYKPNSNLQTFKDKFLGRYESQEVPLYLLMDTDTGIGYGGPAGETFEGSDLLETHSPYINNEIAAEGADDTYSWQHRILIDYYSNGLSEIVLSDQDLLKFRSGDTTPVADSMFIRGSLQKGTSGQLDKDNYRFLLSNCSGPSGVNFISRFCNDHEELRRFAAEIIADEESVGGNVVFAELTHVPQGKVANVSLRPLLRSYEIPYVTPASLPDAQVIRVEDILVSVVRDEVVLRSRRLNKRIIPRLSTAHNFNKSSLPVYRFLCDLQYQHIRPGFIWDWGSLFQEFFLPRVRYKNLILSRARWLLMHEEYKFLLADDIDLVGAFSSLRQRVGMPRYLLLCEADNELYIDAENINSLFIICEDLKQKGHVLLVENLQLEDSATVQDTAGNRYNNELIIPVRGDSRPVYSEEPAIASPMAIQRVFAPGSEWLYVKIYASPGRVQAMLKDVVRPLIDRLLAAEKIDRFFFVRYMDPDHHLRIRFHGKGRFWTEILRSLHKSIAPLIQDALVSGFCTDTYSREIERYGAQNMELSEELFFVDSLFVVRLSQIDAGIPNKKDWVTALQCVDALLDEFGFDLSRKHRFCDAVITAYLKESKTRTYFKKQVDTKFRKEERLIEGRLNRGAREARGARADSSVDETQRLIGQRSLAIRPVAEQILSLNPAEPAVETLLQHYIHMFLNKFFRSEQKRQEIVVYGLLNKYYRSQVGKRQYHKSLVTHE